MERDFTFDEIEEYLAGTLSEERKKVLEDEIKNNPSFDATLEKHRTAHELVRHYAIGEIKNRVKDIHEKSKEEKPAFIATHWMKIAATFLLLCVAGLYTFVGKQYGTNQLFDNSFSAYPNRFSVMGSTEENHFNNGLAHYDKQEYGPAIDELNKITLESEYRIPSLLYIGVSYLALNQADSAISVLQQVNKTDTPYTEAAYWYLALAYLKNNDEEKAIPLLEEIIQSQGFQSHQAEELMQKLNSPWRKLPGI